MLEDRCVPATITWNGPANGLWSAGANWVGGVAPQNEDSVKFDPGTKDTTSKDDVALNLDHLIVVAGYTSKITLDAALSVASSSTIAGGKFVNATNGSLILATTADTVSTVVLANTSFQNLSVTVEKGMNAQLQINDKVTLDNVQFTADASTTWTAGDISLLNATFITNTGSFSIQSSANITSDGTANKIANAANGTVTKSAGSETVIDAKFTNFGNLAVTGGLLKFGQKLLQAQSGNTPTSPRVTVTDLNFLTVPSGLQISAGLLQGSGVIYGDVENGGIVAPGLDGQPGSLYVVGDYTQFSRGTLRIYATNTAVGVLTAGVSAVTGLGGTVSLGGTLQVVRDNAFKPDLGTNLPFLNYVSLATGSDFVTFDFGTNNSWTDSSNLHVLFTASRSNSGTQYDLVVTLMASGGGAPPLTP